MPKSKSFKKRDEKEPVSKKPKLRVPYKQDLKTRQHLNRKCKNTPKAPLNICDLPTEILEKVMGNVNIWHHNRIRATSRRMKDVNDVYVMHEFKKAIHKSIAQDPCSYKSAALRVRIKLNQFDKIYF